jgi:hypothetical protein
MVSFLSGDGDPLWGARDVMRESTDVLKGSCSQNTLKNKRLEPWSYRQERNFIDRERLSRETHRGVRKPGAPLSAGVGIYMYMT